MSRDELSKIATNPIFAGLRILPQIQHSCQFFFGMFEDLFFLFSWFACFVDSFLKRFPEMSELAAGGNLSTKDTKVRSEEGSIHERHENTRNEVPPAAGPLWQAVQPLLLNRR